LPPVIPGAGSDSGLSVDSSHIPVDGKEHREWYYDYTTGDKESQFLDFEESLSYNGMRHNQQQGFVVSARLLIDKVCKRVEARRTDWSFTVTRSWAASMGGD
jgi:hypothetical protein